ncbi:MAG: MOSC domain-containing protein [Candidatus Aenigmatarchaeota archaeon]|nr:MAG: MOSC domain-containing protein [Candidatus Aenigmarchaeota archaeon]
MPIKGRVHQLSVKPSTPGEVGLPKLAIPQAAVTRLGMAGDYNQYRQEVHEPLGDERMALLLMPLETIWQLNDEDWPVKPGDLGENITTEGIPYGAFGTQINKGLKYELISGHTFNIGNDLVAEVAKVCNPCHNLMELPYVGKENFAEFCRTLLGRRGWYARVLDEGTVDRGARITRL